MVAILVGLTFIGLILLDVLIQKWQERRVGHAERLAASPWLSPSGREKLAGWIAVPEGVYLSEGHAWAQPGPEGTVRAGADGLVSRALGQASRVILPRAGDEVTAGDPLVHLELNRRALTVNSPVSGGVAAVNRRLRERPGLVADDPFGDGWICSAVAGPQVRENGAMRLGNGAAEWL
jgi:glycine cleavage system H protein